MSRPFTIKDVAREAGVSIGTVDRVLHNRGRVSDINQKAVKAAVKKLNYSPSQIARALVNRKSNLRIGITYPRVDSDFWSEIPAGIEAAKNKLLPFGVELVIDHTETYDVRDQIASIDKLIGLGVSGLVFTSVDDSSADQLERHIPEDIPYATVVNPAASVTVCGSESVTVVPAARAASTSLTLATPMVIMPGAAAAMASFVRVTPE